MLQKSVLTENAEAQDKEEPAKELADSAGQAQPKQEDQGEEQQQETKEEVQNQNQGEQEKQQAGKEKLEDQNEVPDLKANPKEKDKPGKQQQGSFSVQWFDKLLVYFPDDCKFALVWECLKVLAVGYS